MARKHSDEFKRDAVRIALISGLTRRQVASDLGIELSTLGTWIRAVFDEVKVPERDTDLLRENGIRVCRSRKFKRTTDSDHAFNIAPNLLQQDFTASRPNQKWAGDICLISGRVRAGYTWLLSLTSSRGAWWVGLRANRMKQDLALQALNQVIALRKPPPGCIHHTDRGAQYCAHGYQKCLRQHGFKVSMSGTGNCYDNSVAESFFKSLKAELIWRHSWQTRHEVELALFEYINGLSQSAPQTLDPRLEITRGLRTEGRIT